MMELFERGLGRPRVLGSSQGADWELTIDDTYKLDWSLNRCARVRVDSVSAS